MSDTIVTIKLSVRQANIVLRELKTSSQFYLEKSKDKNIGPRQKTEAQRDAILIGDIITKIEG